MNVTAPEEKVSRDVLTCTSPFFPVRSSSKRKQRTRFVEIELPQIKPKERVGPRPGFMTKEAELPLGPPIDMNVPATIKLDEEDVEWYEQEFKRLEDPLIAFNLRLSVYINRRLYCAKPALIQEQLANDPWKLLIAVMLLNKTTGKAAIPVFWKIVQRWPSAKDLQHANESELQTLLRPLGLHKTRTKRLIAFSSKYVSEPPHHDRPHPSRATYVYVDTKSTGRAGLVQTYRYPPTPISHIPGVGAYALDSYRIFCTPDEQWKYVLPTDKELIRFMRWKWAFFERYRWEPDRGIVAPADRDYLEALPDLLAPG